MDLTPTRTALHGIAELLLAGPQYTESGTIRLRVVPGGIATVAAPDLRLEDGELVGSHGRHPLTGSYAEVAAAMGVTPRALDDVYHDGADARPGDAIDLDLDHLAVLVGALSVGDEALRRFAPSEVPVLWPEHLDVAISPDEVNYGLSPGDALRPEPYAYVGPWTRRTGAFWDQPFGAARPLAGLTTASDVTDFFREGAERAASDPAAEGTAP